MSARWIEFVVTGPRGEPDAFLRGWLAARGRGEALVDAELEGFDCEPGREKLGELFHRSLETSHLLVREDALADARAAFVRGESEAGSSPKLAAEHPVAGARFEFSFLTYSQEEFARLRAMFVPAPKGIRLSPESAFSESSEPEEDPGGVYAPVHEYRGSGDGACEGPIEEILPLWRACRDEELIGAGAPALVYEPQAGGAP